MKIELRCANCRQCFLMEADPGDVELACPACSAPMEIRIDRPAADATATQPVSAQEPAAPAPVQVQAVAAVPAATQAQAATGATAPAVTAAPAVADEVVCPRCNLHFRPRPDAQPDAAERSDTPLVLVVEDMGYFREIAKDALEGSYRVKTATNCAEARQAIAAGGIDLMVLDLTLDGGDHGVDLLRGFPSKPCPILIYTAQDESEMYGDRWDELQALGADDIVMKGMNVGESLLRKVASLLGDTEDELAEGPPSH